MGWSSLGWGLGPKAPSREGGRGKGGGREGKGPGGSWVSRGGLGLAAAAAHVGDVCKWHRSQFLTKEGGAAP